MSARASELGDVAQSAPSGWEAGLGTGRAHLLVTINALDDRVLQEALDGLRSGLAECGALAVVMGCTRACSVAPANISGSPTASHSPQSRG